MAVPLGQRLNVLALLLCRRPNLSALDPTPLGHRLNVLALLLCRRPNLSALDPTPLRIK